MTYYQASILGVIKYRRTFYSKLEFYCSFLGELKKLIFLQIKNSLFILKKLFKSIICITNKIVWYQKWRLNFIISMKYYLNFNECFFLFLTLNTPLPTSKMLINCVYAIYAYTKDLGWITLFLINHVSKSNSHYVLVNHRLLDIKLSLTWD